MAEQTKQIEALMLAAGWNVEMNTPIGEDPTLPNWQAVIDAALKP